MTREDGRRNDEMRQMDAVVGLLKNANGSAMFRMGKSIAIAGVFGPKKVLPKHLEDPEKSILRVEYSMASFATTTRNRPGPNRRSKEISLVTKQALLPVLLMEDFPKTVVDVRIEIIQADASTRCVGINAASLALADAGIPMKDLISSCSAGKANKEVLLDIAGKEDTDGELDLPVAYYPRKKLVTLLQMDGITDKNELKQIIDLAISGCKKVYEVQKGAIKKKYEVIE